MAGNRNGSTSAWRRLREQVLERDGGQCQIRGPGCTGVATHVDHIVPVSKGGSDAIEGLRAACQTCNLRRGDGDGMPAPRPLKWRTTAAPDDTEGDGRDGCRD